MIDLNNASIKEKIFLKDALENNKLAHAYLFIDTLNERAVDTAYWLACYINCTGTNKPDGVCNNCQRILSGNFPDVHYVTTQNRKTLSIDQIRPLKQELAKSPVESKRRIFIINQAQTLTLSAANALLNLLEEPVAPVTTILITNNLDQILPTIQSRTQHLYFNNESQKDDLLDEFTNEQIDQLGDIQELSAKIKYLFQEMLNHDQLAIIQIHELANLCKTSVQEQFVFYELKKLCLNELYNQRNTLATSKLLELLMTADKMKASNVNFRNRLDYVALMEIGEK